MSEIPDDLFGDGVSPEQPKRWNVDPIRLGESGTIAENAFRFAIFSDGDRITPTLIPDPFEALGLESTEDWLKRENGDEGNE